MSGAVVLVIAALAGVGAHSLRATATEIDPGYGNDGFVQLELAGDTGSQAYGGALSIDGDLLVAGISHVDSVSRCTIAKFTSNGDLALDFGENGVFLSDLGDTERLDACGGLAVDDHGDLFSVGVTYIEGKPSSAILIVGLTPDGQLLETFGDHGKVVIDLPGTSGDTASALAIDGEGNLYVAGSFDTLSDAGFDALVIKLDPTGQLVSSFADGGVAIIDFGGAWDAAIEIALDYAGRPVIAGTTNFGAPSDFVAARLTANGNSDGTFGTDGITTVDIDTYDTPYAMTLDANGNVYALVMATADAPGRDVAVVKLDVSGQPVAGFGENGIVHFDWGLDSLAGAIGFGPDANLYVSGDFTTTTQATIIASIDPVEGSPVTGFGDNGVFLHAFQPAFTPVAQCFDSEGRLYLAGSTSIHFAATRILLASPDAIFASGFDP